MHATFAAGCFWHVEEAFRQIKGVVDARSGYAGGNAQNPTYESVCTGSTGHAESVMVTFDDDEVSYEHLLDAFWSLHDPTTVDRQGPDIGNQYRSAIFCHTQAQLETATMAKNKLAASGKHTSPIVTRIMMDPKFYEAEEYHQKYIRKSQGRK